MSLICLRDACSEMDRRRNPPPPPAQADVVHAIDGRNAHLLRFDTYGQPSFVYEKGATNPLVLHASLSPEGLFAVLRASDGLNTSLLTPRYVNVHYRQIVLKLASMERTFPRMGGTLLTAANVLRQLRGRYEREVLRHQRPTVRKMLNRDASPALCMVLSVVAISPPAAGARAPPRAPSSPTLHLMPNRRTQCISVEVTDGWYNVQATLDHELSSQVASGRITVGTKLVTSGAVMKGAEDGIDPLDDGYTSSVEAGSRPPSARLLLLANSTRRARWDARLGWSRGWANTAALKVKLDTVKPGGGDVPLLDVVVHRRFPKMFSVTLTRHKNDTSSTTTLTAAEEEVSERAVRGE